MNSNSSFDCMGLQTLRPVDTSRHQHYHCRHQQRIIAKQPALTANNNSNEWHSKNLPLCIFLSKHCIESVRRSLQQQCILLCTLGLGLGLARSMVRPLVAHTIAQRCDAFRCGPSIDGIAQGTSGGLADTSNDV